MEQQIELEKPAVRSSKLVGDGDARGTQKWIRDDGCEAWPIAIMLSGTRHYLSMQDWREIIAEVSAAIDRRMKNAESPTDPSEAADGRRRE